MRDVDHQQRRSFRWSVEATELVSEYQKQVSATPQLARDGRSRLVTKLVEITGNPRDACLRFLRRFGVVETRSYREWTKPEQQRLVQLIDGVPVDEAARILRRPPASVRSMLHRLGFGARRSRDWFTVSLLAQALHISRDEVERWISRGWLQSRTVQTSGLKVRIIDADAFCEFVKRYGREVVGRRLSYEGLLFVRNYVFPPKHAEMFSVRGTYKKGTNSAAEANAVDSHQADGPEEEGDAFHQTA